MKMNRDIAKFISVLDQLDQEEKIIPGLIMSHPGFGKTTSIRMYCEMKDYNLVSLIPSQSASDDILGIQAVVNGKLDHLAPEWFNRLTEVASNGKRTILFIDEISCTDPFIQGPLLDLIFSRKFANKELPKNTFIIAAGNYSEDLNSAFKLSAPMVNRFLVLNLRNADISVEEFLNDNAENLKAKDLEKYLLGPEKGDDKYYSFELFRKWVAERKEIQFGTGEIIEDSTFGLLGFTSIRSLTYSLQFAESFMKMLPGDLWVRVVGDTLGVSAKREGKHLREIITVNLSKFIESSVRSVIEPSIRELCEKLTKKKDLKIIDQLTKKITTSSLDELSLIDIDTITNLSKIYPNDADFEKVTGALMKIVG